MVEKKFTDDKIREEIRHDFSKNFLIEASAGTGKTTILIERLTNALLSEELNLKPSNIVAITFTNAAAAELRQKIREKIRDLKEDNPDKASEILDGLDSMPIMTIHAFCNNLISQYPVEADTDSDTEPIEMNELDDSGLWEGFVTKEIFSGGNLEEGDFLLKTLGIDMGSAMEYIKLHLRYPDLEVRTLDGPETEEDLKTELVKLFEKYLSWAKRKEIDDNCKEKEEEKLYKYFKMMANKYSKDAPIDEKIDLILNIRNIPKTVAANWEKRGRKSFGTIYRDDAEKFVKRIDNLLVGYIGRKLQYIVKNFEVYYENYKINKGIITHEDSLMKARKLLVENPEIRKRLKSVYKMIFVDEFQDTDPIQAEIISWLCAEESSEVASWEDLPLRKASLTVVGDPKQAIYQFRRADIRTYKKFTEKFADDEKKLLETNFRSDKKIIDTVNSYFKDVMDSEEDGGCLYEKLVSSGDEEGTVEIFSLNLKTEEDKNYPKRFSRDNISGALLVGIARPREADLLAQKVKELIEGGREIYDRKLKKKRKLEYSDIMFLFRKNTNVDLWIKTFEDRGIPIEAVAGSGFFQKAEIKEALQVFRAFANPGDSGAVYGALKSPFFSLSDSDIYSYIKLNSGKLKYLASELPEEGRTRQAIEEMRSIFQEFIQLGDRRKSSFLCERCGMLELYGSLLKDVPATLSIRKLVGMIEAMIDENGWSFVRALREIDRLTEEDSERALSLKSDKASGVRMMTMHGAKGLEAPVVIIGDVSGTESTKVNNFIDRETNTLFSPLTIKSNVTGDFKGEHPDWKDTYNKMGKALAENEEKRIQYVAMTRARNILIIPYSDDVNCKPWSEIANEIKDLDSVEKSSAEFKAQAVERDYPDVGSEYDASIGEQLREEFEGKIGLYGQAAYKRKRPSELEQDPEYYQKEGYGKEHGNQVHWALDYLFNNPDKSIEDIDFSIFENQEAARKHIENAINSKDYKKALSAIEKYSEFSFGVFASQELSLGYIDLVYKDEDGWHIVDYKTNKINEPKDLEKLEEHYQPQMEAYKKAFKALFEEKATTKLLFLDLE